MCKWQYGPQETTISQGVLATYLHPGQIVQANCVSGCIKISKDTLGELENPLPLSMSIFLSLTHSHRHIAHSQDTEDIRGPKIGSPFSPENCHELWMIVYWCQVSYDMYICIRQMPGLCPEPQPRQATHHHHHHHHHHQTPIEDLQ